MKIDDPDSYYYDQRAGSSVWRYGTEQWCNLRGQYFHMVADWSDLAATSTDYV